MYSKKMHINTISSEKQSNAACTNTISSDAGYKKIYHITYTTKHNI